MVEKQHIKVIHAELYRVADGQIEFLIVKRVPHDGDFWQPITGGVEEGEDLSVCLRREILEEAGISELLHVSDLLHQTSWEMDDHFGTDFVHAVQVSHDAQITLNPDEHEDHQWLPLEQALDQLFFEGNKQSMRKVHAYILEQRAAIL